VPEPGPTQVPGEPHEPVHIERRRFLAFLVAAPTLIVAADLMADTALAPRVNAQVPSPPAVADAFDLGDFLIAAGLPTSRLLVLQVTADNRVRFELPRVEMGQGITTAAAMLVAEDLDARLEDVHVSLSDARPELRFNQLTGGSNAVRALYDPVRELAALARARLVSAAAHRWGIPATSLTTRDTYVYAPDGRSASYGSLSAAAAAIAVPDVAPTPKAPAEQRIVGRPTTRIDARDIVTGAAAFTLDLDVPDATPCVVARPPTIRGTVRSFDDGAARRMPGVLAVAPIPTGVAVVAATFGQAQRARDALRVSWGPGSVDGRSDADIRDELRRAIPPFADPGSSVQRLEREYEFAFVNNAPMEVPSAVADVRRDRAEIWTATQIPIIALQSIAKALDLPEKAVTLHVVRHGGAFGSGWFDAAMEAALVSRATGRPIELMWTRADHLKHGRMRPATLHRIQVTHAGGQVLSFENRTASVRADLSFGIGEALTAGGAAMNPYGVAQTYFNLSIKLPYDFGATSAHLFEAPMVMNTSPWRSVYSGTTRTAEEIMVDEVAGELGVDPVALRRAALKTDRARAVLDTVAREGRWGRPLPSGHAQGVGYHEEYRSCAAYLVEIDATVATSPRVVDAVCAVDVGHAINPKGVEAQMLGCLNDAISSILYAGTHIEAGAVRESSFDDFRWTRQYQSPIRVRTFVTATTGQPGGCGELGVPAAAAAVANAFARASGTRARTFPVFGSA
jgi:isoquinoline 1-oxidoreductase subunit beta